MIIDKTFFELFNSEKTSYRRYAFFISIGYFIFTSAYIWASTKIVMMFTQDYSELARIEVYKGWIFVVVTSVLLYLFSIMLFRKISLAAHEIVKSREALIVSERRALAGIFAASMAHDSLSMLSIVTLRVGQLLVTKEIDENIKGELRIVQNAAERLVKINQRLREQGGKAASGEMVKRDLCQVVRESIEIVGRHRLLRSCIINLDCHPKIIESQIFSNLIYQMLGNLMLNATEAIGPSKKGIININVFERHGYITVEVHDNGIGIPSDKRDLIFETFYTTKPNGSGLGLLSVKACAEAHQGVIRVEESPLGGACVRLIWPKRD